MRIAVYSDFHANLTATRAVLAHCDSRYGEDMRICLLGDYIDYGLRPNETLEAVFSLGERILGAILGNHETVCLHGGEERFSASRAADAAAYTGKIIAPQWKDELQRLCAPDKLALTVDGKRLLLVHGDLTDLYWGKMTEAERLNPLYADYDWVLSGHTHIPHFQFVVNRTTMRRTAFLNPGSVGQPRNLSPHAQYAVLDTEDDSVRFEAVAYDVEAEASLYRGQVDVFYAERLRDGR